VDQGNYVTPGDTNGLVVITQIQPISVLFTVPEDNLLAIAKRLQEGAVLPAAAYDRSGANKTADGMLQTFDSQIDPTTGTIKLRAQFPNETRTLYPNQFVNVRLLVDSHKDVTTMSTAGIQRGALVRRLFHQSRPDRISPPSPARRHRWRPCGGSFGPRSGRSHRGRWRR
jgi:multidrug efflux system membrane fusion protein